MKFNKELKNLKNYIPGEAIDSIQREFNIKKENIIKLASNENPYGASKKVIKVIKKHAKNINIYPDDSMFELKNALAKKFKIKKEEIIIGAGSDQIIELILRAKANEKTKILTNSITFSMYEIYANSIGANIIKTKSIKHNINEFKKLYQKYKIDIIFLCIPNNPTGDCLNAKEVFNFLKYIKDDTMVVLDCAYNEFSKFIDKKKYINVEKFLSNFKNIVYLGTFSKAYGLAGIRLGYGIANRKIIDNLYKLRSPFNVSSLALKAGVEALKDKKFIKKSIYKNFKYLKEFEDFAKRLNIKFIKPYTNFITYILDENINSKDISLKLLRRGIIIRDLSSYNINAIRITIAKAKQNAIFFKNFEEIYKAYI